MPRPEKRTDHHTVSSLRAVMLKELSQVGEYDASEEQFAHYCCHSITGYHAKQHLCKIRFLLSEKALPNHFYFLDYYFGFQVLSSSTKAVQHKHGKI